MDDNFDTWNKLKKKINEKERVIIKTSSVWLCHFGENIGFEINGKRQKFIRPALVLIGLGINGGIVLPMTTTEKKSKFLIVFNDKTKVNISQVRYFDSKRFERELFSLDSQKFERIKNIFIDFVRKGEIRQ